MIIGELIEGGKPLKLDVERALLTRILVQANSGGGKSWILRRLLEQTYGKVPHLVLDVDDEFHTLREKYPYVLAGTGAGADVRVDTKLAPLLVRRILEHGFSTIVSIYEMKKHERMRFVRVLLEQLIEAPRALWRPLLVVVDEAHLFCPEKGESEASAAVIDLMTRGRKRGYCGVLATQRISKLHKDAAAEANNKLIGRAALDVDMKRAGDELGFTGREELQRLRKLNAGEFFAFGPAIAPEIQLVKVGGVETTHPEPGSRGNLAPPPAPQKLKAILDKLQDLPKDQAEEEGELARLRRENADLRKENADLGKHSLDSGAWAEQLTVERNKARMEGAALALQTLGLVLNAPLKQIRMVAEQLGQACSVIGNAANFIDAELRKTPAAPAGAPAARRLETAPSPAAANRAKTTQAAPTPRAAASPNPNVSGSQQRVLDALAWLDAVGIDRASKIQLALLAGASPNSSGYANNLGALRTAGLIDYPSPGKVALTEAGRGAAQAPARPPTTEDLHRTLQDKLPRPQWRLLEELILAHPESLGRGELADRAETSATSSGYANNLGALRSLGFIDYPAQGRVIAQPVLFLEG